jgi:glycosyltransferase involved in cell wall biosynthesis
MPVVAHIRNPVFPGPLAKILARYLSSVVAVSNNYARELTAWLPKAPVQMCHDGVEPPVVDRERAGALRAELLGEGTVLICAAGRLDRQKGFSDLVEAARRVCQARPNVRFAIAGDGPLRSELDALISQSNLADRFKLCGFRSDIGNFLAAADLCVSSSLWEGLPIAVVEAMLLGKLVVATDVGGVSEVVIPDKTGWLVTPGAPDQLAAALFAALERIPIDREQNLQIAETAAEVTDPLRNAAELDGVMARCLDGHEVAL